MTKSAWNRHLGRIKKMLIGTAVLAAVAFQTAAAEEVHVINWKGWGTDEP